MYKLVTFAGYDPRTGPHIFPIEADLDRSIGHIKMARALPAKIEEYIRSAKPIPGKTQLLIDAMGAGEFYGSNVNGDYFPEEALRHPGADYGHETFMHYAYPYKHHCFPAGTMVALADGTRAPIESIAKGDLVRTLEGSRPVTDVMSREYSGDGIALCLAGAPDDLTGTPDHPVLVYRRDTVHCPHRYSYLAYSFGCEYKECRSRAGRTGDPEWVPMSSVAPGDYLAFPRPRHGGREEDPAFAELVGWVASEGYLGKKGLIQFTFSDTNRHDIARISQCLRANDLTAGTTDLPNSGTVSVWASSVEMSARLSEYVTGTYSEKALTPKVFEWGSESLLRMLGSYIDGDGHVAQHGRNRGQLRIRSSSPQMLATLSDVIRSLGVYTSINMDCPPGDIVSPTNGEKYATRGSGCVSVVPALTEQVTVFSRKHSNFTPMRRPRIQQTDKMFLVRVRDVEDVRLCETVYNLEVEGAHHYIAGEVVVHNCNKDPARAYGDKVTLADYDPGMHRVLLIIRVDDGKCRDILSDLARNRYWDVSMGCRVPWDECSICHNRAKNRAEYCPHLRYQMNRILPDGRRVFAYNHKPKFFDISFVTIGAEKASHVLRKVAGAATEVRDFQLSHVATTERGMEMGGHIKTSAELGEEYYLKSAATKKATERKRASIIKEVPSKPPAEVEGVTPSDKAKIQAFMDDAGKVKRRERPLPTAALDQLAKHSSASVFSTLAALGVDLRPEEFQHLILTKQGAAPLARKLASHRLVFDEDEVGTKVPSWAKEIRWDENAISEKVATIIRPYLAERSCYPEPLLARLERMEKSASKPAESQWYPMSDKQKREASGIHGLVPLGTSLGMGFLMFRRLFPGMKDKGPAVTRALARHPWMLPLLIGVGVGSSVGLSTMTEPRPLGPFGPTGELDGMTPPAYHDAKVAGVSNPISRLGLIPLSYVYAGVQQKRWQKGHRLNAVDRFIAQRPDLAGLMSFALAPRIGKSVRQLVKHGGVLGNLALYTMGTSSKLMPAVLAGAALDTAIFKMIGRLTAKKGNKRNANYR